MPTTTPARACRAAASSCAPASTSAAKPPQHHHRQHRAVRRDHRRGLLQRRGRRALRGAPVGRHRGHRRHRRPRLRIHDRRHGGRCSARPAATSPPACRRHRLRLRRGRPVRQPLQHRDGVARRVLHLGRADRPAVHRTKLHGDQTDEAQLKKLLEDHNRWTGSRRARELLDDWAVSRTEVREGVPERVQARAGRDARPRRWSWRARQQRARRPRCRTVAPSATAAV
jgi:hypothetical protein